MPAPEPKKEETLPVGAEPQPQVPVGRVRRTAGISIKTSAATPSAPQAAAPTALPLTQEGLALHWAAMVEAMRKEMPRLASLLESRELRTEGGDQFAIIVNNSYVEAEVKPHLIRMLTYLRQKSGRPELNCRIEVVYEEKESVAYTARDKYDVMASANPVLNTFRVLFPDVDI